ncbi:MAG: adenosylcobinamide-phosphate synthase CbiB [Ramlibacter sp.]
MLFLEPGAAALALAVAVALAVDLRLGEPPARLHPVVWIGRYLAWAGRRIAPVAGAAREGGAAELRRFAGGAAAWCCGAAAVTALAWWLQRLVAPWPPLLGALALGLLLKPLLAWRLLRTEVQAVEAALAVSLPQGRAVLARLVSRDVSALSAREVRESAIESLAENLNDSLVAPLFWFALLGLPGAALYRFANTADAMWGYPGAYGGRDWRWAGKWAARADDALSWLPARLTAGLLLAVAGADRRRAAPGALRREAGRTPSPNSGWPMAAMALLLDTRLSKPGLYVLHAAGRPAQAGDIGRAAALAARVALAATGAAALALGTRPLWERFA